MFDIFFALNGTADIIMNFEIDEAFQAIPFGKALDRSFSVFGNPADKIARDANVKNTVGFIREHVDISGHGLSVTSVDGRDKPGHDAEFRVLA
jgi:hypothetical protein